MSTGSSACDTCAKPVRSDEESISCMAFCDRMIHLRCASMKLNKPFLNIIHSSPNLFWMCDECAKLMKCARFKATVSSFGSTINAITERQEIANAEIRKEMAKQGQQIAQLSRRIATSTPIPDFENRNRQPPLKRRRDEVLPPSKPLVGGTKAVTEADVLTVPEPAELFWLYLSRIHPSVKPEAIEKLVKTSIGCEDPINVVPLVKKGTDTSRMSFISYKVGMAAGSREVALCPDTWPKGILFREFEDSSKNMWMPRAVTPTILVSPVAGPSEFSTPTSALNPNCLLQADSSVATRNAAHQNALPVALWETSSHSIQSR